MRRAAMSVVLSLLLAGCASWRQTTEVPVYIHDTTLAVRHERDSIYIDRWHAVYTKGDTVYRTDSVYARRYVQVHDTVWKYRDVPVETEITVEVEKPLTWWQQFRLRAFGWIVLGVLCYVAWKTRRRWNVFLK